VGGRNSSELRSRLAVQLGLPSTLTANALVEAINMLCDEQEYCDALEQVRSQSVSVKQ